MVYNTKQQTTTFTCKNFLNEYFTVKGMVTKNPLIRRFIYEKTRTSPRPTPFLRRIIFPEMRVTVPSELTLASVYYENKVDPCPTSSYSTRECSDCLDLNQVGPAKRIILLALQLFVSHANRSSSFVRKCGNR